MKKPALTQFRMDVLPALQSKIEEFALHGYKDVTSEQLWEYLVLKRWKKENHETMPLHQMVNDILSVKVGDYMHHSRIETFRTSQKSNTEDLSSFRDLFS